MRKRTTASPRCRIIHTSSDDLYDLPLCLPSAWQPSPELVDHKTFDKTVSVTLQ